MDPGLHIPDEGMTMEELSDFVGKQMKRLNLVLKSIDGLNIVDIKFELQGGAYLQFNRKGLVFWDGTKRTVYVDVNGEAVFTGVRVQAVDGAYPNVVFDGSGNIFQASKSATEYIAINPAYTGSPALLFESINSKAFISAVDALSRLAYNVTVGDMQINVQDGNLYLLAGIGKHIIFDGWDKLHNGTQTLQQALDANQITSGDVTVTDGVATLGNNINTTHLADGSVSNTEFQYINTLTGNAQTQLDSKRSGSAAVNTCIQVSQSVGQTVTGGAFVKLDFATEAVDNLNEWDITDSRFTPSANDRTYILTAGVYFTGAPDGNEIALAVYVNGSAKRLIANHKVGGAGNIGAYGTAILDGLATTDYVEVWVYTQNTLTTLASNFYGYVSITRAS